MTEPGQITEQGGQQFPGDLPGGVDPPESMWQPEEPEPGPAPSPLECVHIPTAGRVISAFGVRASRQHPGEERQHNGWDIPGRMGSPVFSIANGVVTHATGNGAHGFARYGRVVVVRHPQFTPPVWSLYAHLSGTAVAPGTSVRAGQIVGLMGNTNGSEEAPGTTFEGNTHLHFEIAPRSYPMRHEDRRIDPLGWFRQRGILYTDGRPAVDETCDLDFTDPYAPPRRSVGTRAIGAVAVGFFILALAAGKKR